MTYTKGIRKLYNPPFAPTTIENFAHAAIAAGYTLFAFNGEVFLILERTGKFANTSLKVDDFSS